MLSAVAARKQQKSVIATANAGVVEPISDVDPVPSSKPPSKRKFDQTNSNTVPRKRKKQALASQGQRMYEEDTKERYSTIVIKSNGRGYSPSAPVAIAEDTGLINPNEDEQTLSTFVPKLGQNFFIEKVRQNDNSESISTSVYLILSLGEKLSFSGSVSLTVVRGTVSMFGCLISASPRSHAIFAPKGYPIAIMEAQELGDVNDPICEVPSILSTQANNKSCIVKLEDLRSGVDEILNLYGSSDTTFEWSQDFSVDWALQDFHPIQTGNRSSMVFQNPSSWKEALDGLSSYEDTPSILIKGPKNTGKSMFARIVTNHLLQKYRRVAYIDCDIGQTEFTPPGMVSLHVLTEPVFGPPFTHLRQPFRAHFVGSTSVRSLHLHYQACVLQLLETYRLDVRYAFDLDDEGPAYDVQRLTEEIPLVINMFGWTKGTGAEITREIETAASLTHVYMLDPDDTLQTNGQQLQSEGISYT
ncbi:Polynucleotide 5'-hydroxyl-kinase grc3, partial [Serendipita sp. 405]